MDFAILGGGRWGTALACHLARLGNRVRIYDVNEEALSMIRKGINPYFRELTIPKGVEVTTDITRIPEFENIICALPVHSVRDVFSKLPLHEHTVINASKGLEISTFMRVSQIISSTHPSVYVMALSGPSFAIEVAKGLPTALVLAYSGNKEKAEIVRKSINSENFRVYLSPDIAGVELGGALKNVIAIACGVSDGLRFGNNARAGLITRGLLEMTRIGVALGAKAETFYGLSGLGDLVLTATSDLSRNRTFGFLIGKGKNPQEALQEIGQTVEGEKTVRPLYRLTVDKGIYAPITEAVYRVVVEGHDLKEVVRELLIRFPQEENPPLAQ